MIEMASELKLTVSLDRGIHEALRLLIQQFHNSKGIKVNSVQLKWTDVTAVGQISRSYVLDSVTIESEDRGNTA